MHLKDKRKLSKSDIYYLTHSIYQLLKSEDIRIVISDKVSHEGNLCYGKYKMVQQETGIFETGIACTSTQFYIYFNRATVVSPNTDFVAVVIHEILHIFYPDCREIEIERLGNRFYKSLSNIQYSRILIELTKKIILTK